MADLSERDQESAAPAATPRRRRRRGSIERGDLEQMVDGIADAIGTGDVKIAAQDLAVPGFVLTDDLARSLDSREQVEGFLQEMRERLAGPGAASVRGEIIRLDRVSSLTVLAIVRWIYLDANGSEVADDRWTCALQRDASGAVKIRLVVVRGLKPPPH